MHTTAYFLKLQQYHWFYGMVLPVSIPLVADANT